jgi:hypothetical protein
MFALAAFGMPTIQEEATMKVLASTLDLTWEDCGTSEGAHVKVNDVEPPVLKLGVMNTITGSGHLDGDRTGGTFSMEMTGVGGSALLSGCSGDAGVDKTCDIGLGPIKVGTTTFHGFNFPIKEGDLTGIPKVDLTLPVGLPSFAETTVTTLKTTSPDGQPDICVKISTKPSTKPSAKAVEQ